MSELNVVYSLPIDISVGTPVVPLTSGRTGNAIITAVERDKYTLVTDFGNEFTYTESELRNAYGEPEWASEHRLFYGTNENVEEALRERFNTQLELIQTQLEKLRG